MHFTIEQQRVIKEDTIHVIEKYYYSSEGKEYDLRIQILKQMTDICPRGNGEHNWKNRNDAPALGNKDLCTKCFETRVSPKGDKE